MSEQVDIEESIADLLQESFDEASTDTESVEAETPQEDSDLEAVAETDDGEDTPTEENEVPVEAEEASEDEEPTGIPAPEHWSSEQKAAFESLSPEAQNVLIERDKEFQKGYQERVQGISEIQQALEPYKGMVAQLGVSEAQAIRTLMAAYNQLLTNPLQGIQNLAQSFGVQDQLKQQFVPDTDDDFTDPEIKALRSELSEVKNQFSSLTQQQQMQLQAEAQQVINDFRTATDEKGNLKHPHYESVQPMIAALIREGKTLEEAYEQAVWTVPEFREAHQPKSKELTPEQKAEKVRRAKKAAATTKTSSKTTASDQEADLSIADELRATWNELAS